MLRNKIVLILILVSLASVYAESDLSYQAFNIKLKAGVGLDYETSRSRIVYFNSDLSFFPRNYYNQEVLKLELESNPRASIKKGNNIEFRWNEIETEKLNYGFDSDVRVKTLIPRIDKAIPYPSSYILEENIKYTKATEFIEINVDIKRQAEETTKGSRDLYEATFRLAEWIRKNIKYDLNTMTEEVVEKSSWVLKNKQGVCDEITNLFISFLRSQKIPARYVTGIAYTDAAVKGWAPHAWAEVYFDNYGWVPFDITFGQYGWVDSGHIKFDEALDPKEPSVEYNWKAVKVGLKDKQFELESSVLEKGEKILPFVGLEMNLLKNKVGGGSFVPIEVKVKNSQPYYLTTLVYMTNAPSVIGEDTKAVLLKPKEEKKVYFLIKVSEDINYGYRYRHGVAAGNNFGAAAESELEVSGFYPILERKDAEILMKRAEQGLELEPKTEKTTSAEKRENIFIKLFKIFSKT